MFKTRRNLSCNLGTVAKCRSTSFNRPAIKAPVVSRDDSEFDNLGASREHVRFQSDGQRPSGSEKMATSSSKNENFATPSGEAAISRGQSEVDFLSSTKNTGRREAVEAGSLNRSHKLSLRNRLHRRQLRIADFSTAIALIGIAIMIIEAELTMANICSKEDFCSTFLKSLISVSTFILIVLVLYYHYTLNEIFLTDNAINDWRVGLSPNRVLAIIAEVTICSVHPLPFNWTIKMYAISGQGVKLVPVSVDVMLGVPMFMRLYLLARLLLVHSHLFTRATSRSIGALNRITFNARFVLKTLMTICPGTILMTLIATIFIIGSWIFRLCETPHNPAFYNLLNSMWLVSITFLAVGYGDFSPETYCGRAVAVISGFFGAGCTALVVAVVARKLELTRSEKHVHNFMMDGQLTKRLKDTAANVLRETWLIFKYSKLTVRPNLAKVRTHQRKLLAATKDLRKMKIEQRKSADQSQQLVDMPRVLMNISDMVMDTRSAVAENIDIVHMKVHAMEREVLDLKAHMVNIHSGVLQIIGEFREAMAVSQIMQHMAAHGLSQPSDLGAMPHVDYSPPSFDTAPSPGPHQSLEQHVSNSSVTTVILNPRGVSTVTRAVSAVTSFDEASQSQIMEYSQEPKKRGAKESAGGSSSAQQSPCPAPARSGEELRQKQLSVSSSFHAPKNLPVVAGSSIGTSMGKSVTFSLGQQPTSEATDSQ